MRHEGEWEEIVDVAETASDVVEDDDFDEWRPRNGEDMGEVQQKSAEKAASDSSDVLEKVEKAIYLGIMLKATPSYYDSQEVSANVNDKTISDEYSVEVAVSEEEKREELQDKLC